MIRKFMKYYRPYMHILIWVIVGTFAMAGLDLIFPVVVRVHPEFCDPVCGAVLWACHECVHRTRHATRSVCSYREALLSLLR